MSKYQQKPLELGGLTTIPIRRRGGKVRVDLADGELEFEYEEAAVH